ncbi:MAG: O-antigen ligase family protein [Caulobacteraceae bacterium]|nr:O-antigen ligase family protein [Caulobacteraceae bacterium]
MTAVARVERRAPAAVRWTRGRGEAALVFWASVALALVFSQFWVMLITGPVQMVPLSVSASLRNYYFPAYAVGLVLALGRPEALGAAALRSPFCAVLVALAFASASWSIDPAVTERRAVAILFTTLCGMAIAARHAWPRLLEVFGAVLAVTLVLSVLTVWLAPRYGLMSVDFPGAWRGVWSHKNTLGYNMSVAFVVFVAAAILSKPRRWLWAAMAAGAVALVIASTSKTSLACCAAAAVCVLLVALGRRGPVSAVAAAYLAATGLVAAILVSILDPGLVFRLVGKDESLTGRTRIWTAVLHQIAKRPAAGYGYGAVWTETSPWGPLPWISREQGFAVSEAHNSWLAVWIELGYLGLGAAAVTLADAWVRTLAGVFKRPSSYFTLPFLAIFSLHTVTESAILVQNDLVWLMFAAVALKLASPEPE